MAGRGRSPREIREILNKTREKFNNDQPLPPFERQRNPKDVRAQLREDRERQNKERERQQELRDRHQEEMNRRYNR